VIEAEIIQLTNERDKGAKAASSMTTFITPFIEEKEKVLVEAFRVCGMRDTDGLLAIKMQFSAIDALKAEMQGFLDTGNLASSTLDEYEAEKAKEKEDE